MRYKSQYTRGVHRSIPIYMLMQTMKIPSIYASNLFGQIIHALSGTRTYNQCVRRVYARTRGQNLKRIIAYSRRILMVMLMVPGNIQSAFVSKPAPFALSQFAHAMAPSIVSAALYTHIWVQTLSKANADHPPFSPYIYSGLSKRSNMR